MKKSKRLEFYHRLSNMIIDDPFIMPKRIAKILKHSGRGKAISTLAYHLDQMYQKKISWYPKLKIKPFENCHYNVYLCRKDDMKDTYSTFLELYKNKEILYIMLLSGADFFIVSRNNKLNLEEHNISIIKESIFYKDTYTIPKGWNKSPEDALKDLINFEFQKGNIQRKFYGILDWSELDWQIFNLMKENVRKKISQVSEKTDATYKTVKKHFKENVLPKCSIAHYFFPEGYDNYRYIYLRIKSDYEISLIDSFKKLPCTTYVYLLDNEMNVIIFYKSHFLILETLKKLKEIGILNSYLLYIPIIHGND